MAKQKTKTSNKGGQYKTSKSHRNAVEKYDKKNTQTVRLKLNKKTDKDIIAILNGSGNKQGTIKNALRSGKSKKKIR